MNRRDAVLTLAALSAAQNSVLAQSSGRIYRLGVLRATAPAPEVATTLLDTLRERGYIEGRNLIIERRFASGQLDRLPGLARELVQLRVDAIVCVGPATVRAGREQA